MKVAAASARNISDLQTHVQVHHKNAAKAAGDQSESPTDTEHQRRISFLVKCPELSQVDGNWWENLLTGTFMPVM